MDQSKYTVPDVFAPKTKKDTDDFAINVARYILNSTKDYRAKMANVYKSNRDVFSGQQSLQYLRDLLQVEENSTYFNIKFTPRPVVKKIIRLVVAGYMQDEEAVNVTALSKHIADKKERSRLEAKFRMENKEFIEEMSNMAGLPLTSSEDFTPDSEEELELYSQMNDKDYTETLMQDTLTYVLNVNSIDNIKKLAIRELCINNLFGVYEYIDGSGKPKIDAIYAEDAIVPQSFHDDFQDGAFFGRFLRMHVADIRRKFGVSPSREKEFYQALDKLNGGSLAREHGQFNSSWASNTARPYDKDTVSVLHVWWKCSKVIEYAEGYKEGNKFFDFWDYPGYTPVDKISGIEGLKVNYKTPPTAYEGYFIGSEYVLEWGEQQNIPYDDVNENVRSPFSYHMPENAGTMNEHSLVHMIKDSVEIMDLTILKIKMLIAKMAPDGYAIDVDSLMELDLGTGSILTPLDLAEITRQTGDIYYRGKDEDGNPNQVPVRSTVSNFGDKLGSLMTIYNFEQDNIRNYIGINEFRDGTANKSRTAAAFAQTQLDQSNMATEFIYSGWASLMTHAVKNIGLRTWYNLKYGTQDKGLLRYLGKTNIEFIKQQKELVQTAFDFEYRIVLTREEKLALEQTIASAIAEGSLKVEDAIMIRQIKNSQVAHKYLTFLSKKRRKDEMEVAEANQRSAAEYAAMSGEKVETAKQATVKMAAEMEMAKEKKRGENQVEAEMTKGALQIILQYAQKGEEVPEIYQPLVDFTIQSATAKLTKSSREVDRELQAMDAEDQAVSMEQELAQAVANGEITQSQMDEALSGQ